MQIYRAGPRVETDYLIVGAGALGMTFADQLLTETDARIAIVDRRPMPGGHWNEAYPFVRLHQPSAFYGVGSRQLGSNGIETSGFNRGYFELASGAEILSYFDAVMRERFVASGRVRYFPMSEYDEGGQIRGLLSGGRREVAVTGKIVDASYFQTSIPATHKRRFEVADGVRVVAPNALPKVAPWYRRFTIVGAGKTAMDVGIWLLQSGAAPDAIRWIAPRDSWLINRETVQPGDAFHHRFMAARVSQMEAAAEASSTADLFLRLERGGQMLRIDEAVTPTMFHSATISAGEVEALRRIKDVVRLGRVERIERGAIVLERGEVAASADELYVDCTASALGRRPTRPVFEDGRITIQTVRAALFCLSAASIAHVEARYDDETVKNRLCPPLALPDSPEDWAAMTLGELKIQRQWAEDPGLRQWLAGHRLTGSNLRSKDRPADPWAKALRERLSAATPSAMANLERLSQPAAAPAARPIADWLRGLARAKAAPREPALTP